MQCDVNPYNDVLSANQARLHPRDRLAGTLETRVACEWI